jgi:DNA polymerase-3 subunit alpha
MSFVHLHCHTEFSILDGAIRPGDLVKKAAALGMPAVAITDHGNMHGAVTFYQAARAANIKPVIGCEVYVAPGSMREKSASSAKEAAFHLTLLARNAEGYQNLVKLSTLGYLEGFYYKPRIDHELLAAHSKGLVVLSGCLKGELASHLAAGQIDAARETIGFYRDVFGPENYFIEIHDHGMDVQRRVNPQLVDLARRNGLRLVAANDVHFLEKSHHEAHDVLICIGTGANLIDEKRLHYSPELYFKTPDEMRALFRELPEACDNTLALAEQVDFEMEFGVPKYPNFDSPDTRTREQYLRDLCHEGMERRFGPRLTTEPELTTRLDYELGVIEKTGFVSYFLIVWDFIRHAREQGIPVGPGRGSAAGSLIAYALGITDIDPLRYGLIFERFLNPERVSPPDIDVDFCMERRNEVIDYVKRKYGERAVSQIITFGTLGAKSVVRDVARVMGWSFSDGDRIAKLIPNELQMDLKKAEEKNPELKALIESDPSVRQLWDYATVLEGLSRNAGIHAAGVVIGDRPLDEFIPLCKGKDNEIVTQYAMGPLTDLGMLKMDFLGLRTLTIIQEAVRLVRLHTPDFDIDRIAVDDKAAFDIYNRGETLGVFQMESGGITNCCKRFDVSSIEDIIAIGALYRPGPMQFIDTYIERKKGLKKIEYLHPLLQEVCAETQGIIVYQEQVQRAASVLAGYSLGEADLLRRAMGKKDKAKMDKERPRFVQGCGEKNNIPPKVAEAIWEFIKAFAEYGFNKSHSAAYGWVSYQTAYLKAHHPREFMSAMLTFDANDTDRLAIVIAECRRMDIPILPPNVNTSGLKFSPDAAGPGIRFGLASIKNVGAGAMESAIAERVKNGPFRSLEDFCSRLDSRTVNRKIMESLIKCGAFDGLGPDRASLFADLEPAMAVASALQRDRASGQVSLFAEEPLAPRRKTSAVKIEPWSMSEMLAHEKELLGYYVSGHPLDAYAGHFDSGKYQTIAAAKEASEPGTFKLAGLIASVEKKFSKKDGKPFGILVLEDFTGTLEMTAWDEAFSKNAELLVSGAAISINTRIQRRDEAIRASAGAMAALKPKASVRAVRVRLDRSRLAEDHLTALAVAVRNNPGKRPLLLELVLPDGRSATIAGGESIGIGDERRLREEIVSLPVLN